MNDTTPEMIKAQSVQFQHKFDLLKSEVQKMIVGQDELVERVLIAIIAGGMFCWRESLVSEKRC